MTTLAEEEASVSSASPELEPNEFRVADVRPGGATLLGDVAVFNVNGTLYATQAQCPHMGGPLCEGKLEGTVVTCPLHGSRFDVTTGDVLRGPAESPLELYVVRVKDGIGTIEVALDD